MLSVNFTTENDAFQGPSHRFFANAVAHQLREVAKAIENGVVADNDRQGTIQDINGNTIGTWRLTRDAKIKEKKATEGADT